MMRKKVARFPVVCVLLLFLTSCGIPRMFPWTDNQYDLTGYNLAFSTKFETTSYIDGQPNIRDWDLTPRSGTPVLRIYYMLLPEQGSSGSSLISSFNSNYRNSFPPNFGKGDAVASTSISSTAVSDGYVSTSMYEMTVVDDNYQFYTPASNVLCGIDFFPPEKAGATGVSSYNLEWTVSWERTSAGYYLMLAFNNGETVRLGRMNGEPFPINPSDYAKSTTGDAVEFTSSDEPGLTSTMILRVYLTASFAYEGYTTRSTIPLTYNTTVFSDLVTSLGSR